MEGNTKLQKGLAPIFIILIIILGIGGISGTYGAIEYHKTSKIVKEAEQLTKEEKYNEAIEKLEFAQKKLFGKMILKQKIGTELDTNKKLLEDKTEYTQGVEEFEKGNFENAKELLSKVSEESPYYKDAKGKIEETKQKIEEARKAEKKAQEETGEEKPIKIPEEPKITCQNECSPAGSKRCSDNGYQICGNYDADECLEWGSITNCLQNTICQNGICIQQEQKCTDGTPYGQCSTDKPKYCENGSLINKCSICGCPANTVCQDEICIQQEQKCPDGTLYGQCSTNKPKYCDNGNLVERCSICGCPSDYYCNESNNLCILAEKIDMLIFISPQYTNNTQVRQAIDRYVNAVKEDIGWDTKIINITPEINDFIKIDKIIEDYYRKSGGRLKGAIMVGEDINTAVKAEAPGQESPSITPWATNDDYTMIRVPETIVITDDTDKTSEALKGWKVLGELKRVDVVISLLYPPHNLDYQTRAQQIRSVFEKFSENRNKIHTKETVIFVDPELKSAKELHQTLLDLLGGHSEIYSKESPTKEEIEGTLNGEYMLYVTDGHGTPSAVQVSPPPNRSDFYAEYLSSLNTPLFLGGGCYTEGWWSSDYSCSDWWCSGQLDYSINENWFGAKIFTNPYLRVEVLGAPFQGGAESPQRNFIGMAISDLIHNKTLAESLKGDLLWNIDSSIIYGDLTFHYNF